MQLVIHQDAWTFVEREVLPTLAVSSPINVYSVLPLERDLRASTERVQIDIAEEDAEKISDRLLDLFCAKGLQPDDEPNAYGRYVEDLSTIFHHALYST